MKKTLLLLVALITATIAFAQTEIDGIYYNLNDETKTAEVTSNSNKYSGDITIPEKVTYNATEYSVTSIGEWAFYECSSLTSISIPNSVTSIGYAAFLDCSSLTSISIPNSVTSIGEGAFAGCSALTSISIPNSVTSIGSQAFHSCSSLTSITIPNSVTSIGEYAFSYCSALTSITIGNSVTSIGSYTFRGCTSLTSITIGNSVTSIGSQAFHSCTSLTSITIPNSVTSIGEGAFSYCSALTSITIPNSVTSIDGATFRGCSSLTSITIPNSVTSIGDLAFYECSSLTSISIPNSVTSIGYLAFYKCSSLTSIEVNANNPNYASIEGALYNKDVTTLICCPGDKTSITIPNSVTEIGDCAFSDCSSLTSITIPNSVTSIGNWAFEDCSSLTSITCLGSTPPSANDLQAQYETCILFVPKGSLNDYQNHAEWGKFLNIQELEGEKYTITTAVNDDTMGSVTEGGEYAFGTEITLTATANSGYRFVQWSDGNTDNPRTIIVTQDSTFTAIFELEEYALYATSASPELGYVKHTIEAIAIEGFEFDGWSDGNTDNPRTIVLTEDTKLYAYFRMAQGGNPTDLENSKISSANIYTTNGTLHIEGATYDYHILDAAGRLIYSGNATTLQLPRGIYLITIGGEVEKIVL